MLTEHLEKKYLQQLTLDRIGRNLEEAGKEIEKLIETNNAAIKRYNDNQTKTGIHETSSKSNQPITV